MGMFSLLVKAIYLRFHGTEKRKFALWEFALEKRQAEGKTFDDGAEGPIF